MKRIGFSAIFFLGIVLFPLPLVALAQETSIISSTPYTNVVGGVTGVCLEKGECTLCDLLLVGIRLTRFLLGVSGAVALLFLIVAGLYFLVSAGNQELIGKAKMMIKAVVWGFLFVFLSWQIINFVLLVFLKPDVDFTRENTVATVSGQIWSELTCKGWRVIEYSVPSTPPSGTKK